jgi:hypothetical protein
MLRFGPDEVKPDREKLELPGYMLEHSGIGEDFDGPNVHIETPLDYTQVYLRAMPQGSYRLDNPSIERIIELSHLFKPERRTEKYYWQGISELPNLNDEIVSIFPARIVVDPDSFDVLLSDEFEVIFQRLHANACNFPQGEDIYSRMSEGFDLSFGELLAVVAAMK